MQVKSSFTNNSSYYPIWLVSFPERQSDDKSRLLLLWWFFHDRLPGGSSEYFTHVLLLLLLVPLVQFSATDVSWRGLFGVTGRFGKNFFCRRRHFHGQLFQFIRLNLLLREFRYNIPWKTVFGCWRLNCPELLTGLRLSVELVVKWFSHVSGSS